MYMYFIIYSNIVYCKNVNGIIDICIVLVKLIILEGYLKVKMNIRVLFRKEYW